MAPLQRAATTKAEKSDQLNAPPPMFRSSGDTRLIDHTNSKPDATPAAIAKFSADKSSPNQPTNMRAKALQTATGIQKNNDTITNASKALRAGTVVAWKYADNAKGTAIKGLA